MEEECSILKITGHQTALASKGLVDGIEQYIRKMFSNTDVFLIFDRYSTGIGSLTLGTQKF